MIRVPRLKVNRLGVYGLRVVWTDEAGKRREATHSLRTKSPEIARVLALQFNEAYERKRSQRRMSTKKPEHLPYELIDRLAQRMSAADWIALYEALYRPKKK